MEEIKKEETNSDVKPQDTEVVIEQVPAEEQPEFVFDGSNCRRNKGKFITALNNCWLTINDWWSEFQKKALWILIFLIIGVFIGERISNVLFERKVDESVKLGGMVFKDKIYDIKERIK